jgi:hypothetical protein
MDSNSAVIQVAKMRVTTLPSRGPEAVFSSAKVVFSSAGSADGASIVGDVNGDEKNNNSGAELKRIISVLSRLTRPDQSSAIAQVHPARPPVRLLASVAQVFALAHGGQ